MRWLPTSHPRLARVSEEHDDAGQYANVDGEEDASTDKERGNCHGWPHIFRTQNTRCGPAVPKYWKIDQKQAEGVGSACLAVILRVKA